MGANLSCEPNTGVSDLYALLPLFKHDYDKDQLNGEPEYHDLNTNN
jgi:hypothetical protein